MISDDFLFSSTSLLVFLPFVRLVYKMSQQSGGDLGIQGQVEGEGAKVSQKETNSG